MEAGSDLHRHPRPVERADQLAAERLDGDFGRGVIDAGQRILRVQAHIDALAAAFLRFRHGSGARLVADRLAGRGPALGAEPAEIPEQDAAHGGFVHVAHKDQHPVVHPGEQGLVELGGLGLLRARIQSRRIFLRRIAEARIHHRVEPVVHRFPGPSRIAEEDVEFAPVHRPAVREGEQRLQERRQLGRRRLPGDGRVRHGDLRVHPDAVHGQVVAEIGRGKAAGVIQGQHVPGRLPLPSGRWRRRGRSPAGANTGRSSGPGTACTQPASRWRKSTGRRRRRVRVWFP